MATTQLRHTFTFKDRSVAQSDKTKKKDIARAFRLINKYGTENIDF